jgi:CelD/BcsL family acetyltransferase involved in cellulose biosynthesis
MTPRAAIRYDNPMSRAIVVKCLESAGALEALEPRWRALWRRCPDATPFQSPAWLLPWSRHIRRGRLLTFAGTLNGRLVGLAPLYLAGGELRLLGEGESDSLDFIVETGREKAFVAAVHRALEARAASWRVCLFRDVAEGSSLWRGALALPAAACFERARSGDRAKLAVSRVSEAGSPAARMLTEARLKRRRLERAGPVTLSEATRATLSSDLETLFKLHRRRWDGRPGGSGFARRSVRAFFRDAAPGLLAEGALRLHVLRAGARPVAAHLWLSHRGRGYGYLHAFDQEFARFSPGTLMAAAFVEACAREGLAEADLGRGEEPYKRRWGPEWESAWVLSRARDGFALWSRAREASAR